MAEQGTFYWNELTTTDPAGAAAFFASLTGCTVDVMKMDFGDYRVLKVGGRPAGGIMGMSPDMPPDSPPQWFSYMVVEDVDAACARTKELGGMVLKEPWDVPEVGRIAFIADPTGAALGIITPAPMPAS